MIALEEPLDLLGRDERLRLVSGAKSRALRRAPDDTGLQQRCLEGDPAACGALQESGATAQPTHAGAPDQRFRDAGGTVPPGAGVLAAPPGLAWAKK